MGLRFEVCFSYVFLKRRKYIHSSWVIQVPWERHHWVPKRWSKCYSTELNTVTSSFNQYMNFFHRPAFGAVPRTLGNSHRVSNSHLTFSSVLSKFLRSFGFSGHPAVLAVFISGSKFLPLSIRCGIFARAYSHDNLDCRLFIYGSLCRNQDSLTVFVSWRKFIFLF